MTTNDLQSLIDDMARSIAAFNDSEQTWQDCPERSQSIAHRKGRYCEHQVRGLARHLVANKHPVQGIEDARHKALVEALEALLDPKYTGGYCPWCGNAFGIPHAHYCIVPQAQAALKLEEEA